MVVLTMGTRPRKSRRRPRPPERGIGGGDHSTLNIVNNNDTANGDNKSHNDDMNAKSPSGLNVSSGREPFGVGIVFIDGVDVNWLEREWMVFQGLDAAKKRHENVLSSLLALEEPQNEEERKKLREQIHQERASIDSYSSRIGIMNSIKQSIKEALSLSGQPPVNPEDESG
eukprot:1012182_1